MRVSGQVTTVATTRVPVNATAYTEQTSGAQRSFKSSSNNDTLLGTGVRKVKAIYFTLSSAGRIRGPFKEIVELNGQIAVPMVATDVALVERVEAYEVGSSGVAAGAVSMYDDDAGAGSVICSIAAGATRTLLAHHYVPSGSQCRISDLEFAGGDSGAAGFDLAVKSYLTGVEEAVITPVNDPSTGARQALFPDLPLVIGPARIRAMVAPANNNSQTSTASFGVRDEVVVFGG